MKRLAWFLGNWLAQVVCSFRVGYRDGYTASGRPKFVRAEFQSSEKQP